MKTFRKRKIWISSLLALSLLINVLSASAEGADNHSESTTTETEQNYVESPIVNEDVSKRGENEKHFLCEDGSYIAVAYADAVHEKNEQDEWTEIDNTLAFENNRIENHSESFHTSFSETANPAAEVSANTGERLNNSTANASDGQLVSIESGENRLSWSLSATSMLNAQQTAQLQQQGCVLESAQGDLDVLSRAEQFIGALPAKQLYRHSLSTLSEAEVAQKSLPENPTNDDIINNLKTSSSVIYQNALGNDVDLQYTVNPGRIKEDIIINERGTFVSYTMNLDTGGLIAVLNDDNSVSFLDNQEKVCFTISVPYMYDSADTESYDIDVEMLQNGNNCMVTFIPDANWLNDSTRVYPVTIDPNLYTGQTTDFYADTYVIQDDNTFHGTEVKMYCGYRSGKKNRAYLRITKMPVGLPLASQITGATLIVPCLTGTTSSKPFSLYQVNGSWDEGSLRWDNQPSETLLESGIDRGSDNIVRFSSTNLKDHVCKYYANVNNNYGFSIRYTNETANDYNSFYTKENGNSGGRPKLKITYYPPANIADGTYYVRSKHSGHYLDAANSGGAGANVSQYGFHGATNQQWVFRKQTADNTFKGYYRISPAYNTGLYLDVANGNASNETNIQVYTRTEANAQHWTIIDNGNGSYRIMSKASSNRKCATVQNASTSSGANVFQYQYNGSGNDEWYLERAYNMKVYQSPRMPGKNEDGTQADDMKVNDYSKAQLTFANLNFNTYANTYDEQNVIDGPSQVKNHMYLLADTFAVNDSSMKTVVRDMIKHFQDGSGTPYRNSTLTKKAVAHQSTQNYINGTKNLIVNWLKAHEGNPSNITSDSNLRAQLIKVGRPHYNTTADLTNGLTISINDTWGNYIELKNYKVSDNSFQGKLRFTIYDHFGLNEPDLTGSLLNMVKGCMRGFGSWFVLQHYTGCAGKYKPFITYIETEVDISGTF